MAERVSARLSASEGRKFALVLSVAFGALGALFWWRDHVTLARVLVGVSVVWAALGFTIPSHLGGVQRVWMGGAEAISKVTTPVILGVVYFLVITPIAGVMRAFGKDPLRRRLKSGSYWVSRSGEEERRGTMRNQF